MRVPEPKVYFLPLAEDCLPECGICASHGCRNLGARSEGNLSAVFARASRTEHTEILFSAVLVASPAAAELVASVAARGLAASVQLDLPSLLARSGTVAALVTAGLGVELVLRGHEKPEAVLSALASLPAARVRISFSPLLGVDPGPLLARLWPRFGERLHFHFVPFRGQAGDLTAAETAALLRSLRKSNPDLVCRAPYGREVWDTRINPRLALEPDAEPLVRHELPGRPRISVVIPSFNSGALLKNVLRHLLRQHFERAAFEIIVVDDGSDDGTKEIFRDLLAAEAGNVNASYFYLPRATSRRRGDGNFRAGIARNLGAHRARGAILLFLDSDIIVAPGYLKRVEELHQGWDVVQSVRLHLKNRRANASVDFESVTEGRDTFVLEAGYWGPFFRATDWAALPFFWKYTCTYALSVKASMFRAVGGFRRTFVYYGFEDTDLGYRLWRAGARFHLDRAPTYHLEASEDRTEYRASSFERTQLLGKTAKVFFLNNLDLDIFDHFRGLMGQESAWWQRRRRARQAKELLRAGH